MILTNMLNCSNGNLICVVEWCVVIGNFFQKVPISCKLLVKRVVPTYNIIININIYIYTHIDGNVLCSIIL